MEAAVAHVANCAKTPVAAEQRRGMLRDADAALRDLRLRVGGLCARAESDPSRAAAARRHRDRLTALEARLAAAAAAAAEGAAAVPPEPAAELLPYDLHADTVKSVVMDPGRRRTGAPYGSPEGSPALSGSLRSPPRDPCGSPLTSGSHGWAPGSLGSPPRSPSPAGAAPAAGARGGWVKCEASPLSVASLAFALGRDTVQSLSRTQAHADSANEAANTVINELQRQHETELAVIEHLGTLRSQVKRARRDLAEFAILRMRDRCFVGLLIIAVLGSLLAVVLRRVNPMGVSGVPGPDPPQPFVLVAPAATVAPT